MVYKRGDIWWYSVSFSGYRERKPVGVSKRQALEVFYKRKLELRDGLFFNIKTIKSIRLQGLVDEYLAYSNSHKRSFCRDKYSAKNLLSFFGDVEVNMITPQTIEKYIQSRKKTIHTASGLGITNATINRELFCLSSVYRLGIVNGHVNANPVTQVKKLKEQNKRLEYLSAEEVNALIDKAKGYLNPILLLALHCGLRRSEVLNLKWQDISFETETIQIYQTKNGKPRTVYMTSDVKSSLMKWFKNDGCEYVFHNQNGIPFTRVVKSFRTALKAAGIRHIRFHDLRHTYASHAVMNGVDLITLKEMLGHATTEMVERYAHLSDSHKREAAQKICAGFNNSSSKKDKSA